MLVLLLGDLHLPLRASSLPLKFRKLLVPGKIQQIICTGNVCDRETWDYLRTVAPDVRGVRGDFDESPHLPPTLIVNHPPLRLGIIHGHQILPIGDPDLLYSLATTMDVDVLVSGSTHRFKAVESGGKFFIDPGSATGAWCSVWPLFEEEDEEEKGEKGEGGDEVVVEASSEKEDKKDQSGADGREKKDTKGQEGVKEAEGKMKGQQDQPKTQDSSSPSGKEGVPSKSPKPYPDPIPSFVLLDIQGATIMSYVYQLIDGEVKVEKIEYRKDMETATSVSSGTGMIREMSTSGYGGAEMGVGGGMAGPRW